MKARYQIRKRRLLGGRYLYALIDMQTPDASSSFGFHVISTGTSASPINPPVWVSKRQATLNTSSVLDADDRAALAAALVTLGKLTPS
jgi:hypothetical protein